MSDKRAGYVKLLRIHGIPLFVHWSVPAGGLLISAFAGFRPVEAAYFCLAYVFLICTHEFGHVAAARFLGLAVFAIDLSGLGGQCRLQPPTGIKDTLLVFSAGLLAQIALLTLTLLYLAVFGLPASLFGVCVVQTFTVANVVVLVLNIIPGIANNGVATDGYVLWRLFLHVFRKQPHPLHPISVGTATIFPPDTSLLSIEGLAPAGFATGIEILNDNTTPMDFVVATLSRNLNLDRAEAIALMLAIHRKGGELIPLPKDRAQRIAAAITSDARQNNHGLVCRAIDALSPSVRVGPA